MTLNERKRRVLQAVVDDYIETAMPVGSRTIARKYGLGVSPATIRNEMADLEELGYLEQPHASAGRVPSDKGYRFYVDCLMQIRRLAEEEIHRIEELLQQRTNELEQLIYDTARILSETTNYLALVLGPGISGSPLRHLQLIPMTDGQLLLVFVTTSGVIEHRLLETKFALSQEEAAKISWFLNRTLGGRSIADISSGVLKELYLELHQWSRIVREILGLLRESLEEEGEDQIYFGGALNILSHPEFRDVERARRVLKTLDQARLIRELLSLPVGSAPVDIRIGREITIDTMQECSVVTGMYCIGNGIFGRLGVIGPKRMEYGKVVAIVQSVAESLSHVLCGHTD